MAVKKNKLNLMDAGYEKLPRGGETSKAAEHSGLTKELVAYLGLSENKMPSGLCPESKKKDHLYAISTPPHGHASAEQQATDTFYYTCVNCGEARRVRDNSTLEVWMKLQNGMRFWMTLDDIRERLKR